MPTYEFSKDSNGFLMLKSKKYRVTAFKAKGYVYVIVSGTTFSNFGAFRVRGLTAIHDKVNDFEMKVIALYFAKQAREFGKNMPTIQYVNYAQIFGSLFD